MKTKKNKNNKTYLNNLERPLKVWHSNGVLKMEIGLNRMEGNDKHPTIPELKIIDFDTWGDDLVRELCREEENGASLLTDLLDKAIEEAIDMGSVGIDFDKYEKEMEKRKSEWDNREWVYRDGWKVVK